MANVPLDLRDQLNIDTPELVSLEFSVSGLGSRSIACIVDYLIQGVAFTLVLLLLVLVASFAPHTRTSAGPPSHTSEVWAMAIFFIVLFLAQWGYFSLFEAFWNGQTPGKRLLRLRVIQQSGRSIGFLDALSRNLLRIVDQLPGFYLVGIVFLFTTRRSQRLGDLVAGTLVIHEKKVDTPMRQHHNPLALTDSPAEPPLAAWQASGTGLPADVVARLTPSDLELIDSFESRRLDLPWDTSSALAEKLAQQMAQKMQTTIPSGIGAATFLESLASEMRSIGAASHHHEAR
ncbi:MAG: RDD family protein [Acidobacteriaceae bacterium]